jgi:hypothetical protein
VSRIHWTNLDKTELSVNPSEIPKFKLFEVRNGSIQ